MLECSPLLTDRYELSMLEVYATHGMTETAVFELFVRKLPPGRGFLMAAGAAGCSVLLEGVFTDSDEQNAIAALPPMVRVLPCWLGSLPSGLNRGVWRSLDGSADFQSIVAMNTVIEAGGRFTPVNATP